MSDFRALVDAAGGQRKAARFLGVPITTLHAWVKNNRAPEWRSEQIAKLRSYAASREQSA